MMTNLRSSRRAVPAWTLILAIAATLFAAPAATADTTNDAQAAPLAEVERLEAERDRLYEAGRFAEAIGLARRVLALREKGSGSNHVEVARSINALAVLLEEEARHAEAEKLHRRALAIREKELGPNHLDVAESLSNLGIILQRRRDYAGAEQLYRRALAITERSAEPDSMQLAACLSNLGGLLYAKGDFAGAEKMVRRVLAIEEKTLGPDHPTTAQSLNHLAMLLKHKGDYKGAEEMMRRALAMREKALGPDHPDLAAHLITLGTFLRQSAEFEEAETVYRRALAIREKVYGPNHYLVAPILIDLAALNNAKTDFEAAEPLMRRALAIEQKALGPHHAKIGNHLGSLAVILAGKGDMATAEPLLARSLDIRDRSALRVLQTGSSRQKRAFFATLADSTNLAISHHTIDRPAEQSALELALRTILRRKGLTAEVGASGLQRAFDDASGTDQRELLHLARRRASLAKYSLNGPEAGTSSEEYRHTLERLQSEVEELERDLSARHADLRVDLELADVKSVQAALPPDSALVEYVVYTPIDFKQRLEYRRGRPRYAAYILPSRGEPTYVDLDDAMSVDFYSADFRKAIAEQRADLQEAARRLDVRVMEPVRKKLGSISDIYVAPDGALNLVPFAALVDQQGDFLVTRYRINLLTTGRDLLRFRDPHTKRSRPLVVGGPAYGAKGDGEPPGSKSRGKRSVDFRQIQFTPLPGTVDETAEISRLLPNAEVLTNAQATEGALKRVRSPQLLHIATHGFFLENTKSSTAAGQRGFDLVTADPANVALPEDPMLRAGLALAGANLRQSGDDDDGILTALEASGLDLRGTQLVVLSACETALGQVNNGDGVYGLRRALVVAGAETQVMSLWKVDDEATRQLMTDYYRRVLGGAGRIDALRRAQLAMLADPDTKHPYYWAAFIAAGDSRTLDYRDPPPVWADNGESALRRNRPRRGGCACSHVGTPGQASPWACLLSAAALALVAGRRGRRRRLGAGW